MLARKMAEPWFRCQALTFAAEHTADVVQRRKLLRQAFQAADRCDEPNRIVSVAAWPLGMLATVGEISWFEREFERLLALIATEPHPIRRGDALLLLVRFFGNAPLPAQQRLMEITTATWLQVENWKRDRVLTWLAEEWTRIDRGRALALAQLIRVPRLRRHALRALGVTEGVEVMI